MPPNPEIESLRAVVEAQSALVKNLTDVLASSARQSAQSPLETLKELLEIQRLMQPAPAPAPPMPGAIAPGGSPWVAIADRIAGVMEAALQRSAQPSAARPATSTAGKPVVNVPPWAAPLIPWIPQLLKGAKSGTPADVAAGYAAGEIRSDEQLLDQLLPILASDGYPSNVIGTFPDLQAHAEWITAFLFSLRGELAPAAAQPQLTVSGGRKPRGQG